MAWMISLNRFSPPFIHSASGAVFTDVDGNDYLDFNVADLSMTMGYGPAPRRSAARFARGRSFFCPPKTLWWLVAC